MSRSWRTSRWSMTFFVIVAFLLNSQYTRRLPFLASLPGQVRTSAWQALQGVFCLVAVALVHRLRPGAAFRELGFGHLPLRAAAFSLAATLPMFLVYGHAAGFTPRHLDWVFVFGTAVRAPIAEEVLFRGFLFGQLRRRAGWPFWGAAMLGMVPFALGHYYQGDQAGHGIWGLLGVLAITGVGHLFFTWLLERWGDLWVPIGMHALMNYSWHLFGVDDTALGDVRANVARFATVGLALGLTLWLRRGKPTWTDEARSVQGVRAS